MSNPYRHPISTPVPELQGKVSIASKSPPSCAPGEVERLATTCRDMLDQAFDYYTARNGKRMSIEGDDGEKCWIVPFEPFEDVRRALAALSPQGLDAKEGGE